MDELPKEKIALQEGDEQDPEKVMHVTRVETRVVMLKLKYGMEVGDKVDTIINKLVEDSAENPLTAEEEKHRLEITVFTS